MPNMFKLLVHDITTLNTDYSAAMNNLLNTDGQVYYFGKILSAELAHDYYEKLLTNIAWQNDKAVIYGKEIITKRKVAWYADQAFKYTYSRTTKTALPWTPELRELKQYIEQHTQEHFNSCLLNLYHDGNEGMAWHSDNEKDLKKNGTIASLSLGAERKFLLKHKQSKQRISILLEHGSLLTMQGTTQTYWLHRLPPTKKVFTPRINLTFRSINV